MDTTANTIKTAAPNGQRARPPGPPGTAPLTAEADSHLRFHTPRAPKLPVGSSEPRALTQVQNSISEALSPSQPKFSATNEVSSQALGYEKSPVAFRPQTLAGDLTPEDDELLYGVTDWYIPEGDEASTRVYPGPAVVDGRLLQHTLALSRIIKSRLESGLYARDFRLEYGSILLRGHTQPTVDGVMYILRRFSRDLPDIRTLGLPEEVRRTLTSPKFAEQGGLILICGGTGHGKSTTVGAVIVERVTRSGNFCLCVEDPPEFMLHGDHPAANGKSGKIIQVPAQSGSFSEDLRDALRCYPSNIRGSMLLIGEIRDAHTAAEALQAAMNGQLVLSTMHASDPIAALERILAMSKEFLGNDAAHTMLAHSLRAIIEQRIVVGKLEVSYLFSSNGQSSVGAGIASGNVRKLVSEIEQQRVFVDKGVLLSRLGLELHR